MPLLHLKDVTKTFGGVQAIKGSTFGIENKKITALIGPNGAGKTTLFDIICGLLKPDGGVIVFNDQDISSHSMYKRINLGISRTFQQVRLFQYLTILDHFLMIHDHEDTKLWKNVFGGNKLKRVDRKKYEEILKEFGIDKNLDACVKDLSYGQRKLLQIALCVYRPHRLLMFDEPVAGVNSVVQARIEELLLKLKQQGETMLLIDHDMNFVRKLADKIIVLDAGVVLMEGSPDDVLNDERVLDAYLGM